MKKFALALVLAVLGSALIASSASAFGDVTAREEAHGVIRSEGVGKVCRFVRSSANSLGYVTAEEVFGEGWAEEGGSVLNGEWVFFYLAQSCISHGYRFSIR